MNNNESYLSIFAILVIANYITNKIMKILNINEKYKKTKFFISCVVLVIMILLVQNIFKVIVNWIR